MPESAEGMGCVLAAEFTGIGEGYVYRPKHI